MRSTTVSSARSVGFPPAQVYGLTVLGFFILRFYGRKGRLNG